MNLRKQFATQKLAVLSPYDITTTAVQYFRLLKIVNEDLNIPILKFNIGEIFKEKFSLEKMINLSKSVWYKIFVSDNLITIAFDDSLIYKSLFNNISIDGCSIEDVKVIGCHHPESSNAIFDSYLLKKKSRLGMVGDFITVVKHNT